MPINSEATTKRETSTSQSGRKVPGTRLGVMLDWRVGASKAGKISGRHGHAIRDGR